MHPSGRFLAVARVHAETFGAVIAQAVTDVPPAPDALPLWLNTATAAAGLLLLGFILRMVLRGDLVSRSTIEAIVDRAVRQTLRDERHQSGH